MSSLFLNTIKKRTILFLSIFILFLCIFISLIAIVDHFQNEDRDFALNKEMLSLAHELDAYKTLHGKYPDRILDIRNSDELCVTITYTNCQKVYYIPLQNNQDFHLAMRSFTWVILWYRKGACMDSTQRVSQEESQQLHNTFGTVYYFCAAIPQGSKPSSSFPIYREDKKIFDNPDEWPVL